MMQKSSLCSLYFAFDSTLNIAFFLLRTFKNFFCRIKLIKMDKVLECIFLFH